MATESVNCTAKIRPFVDKSIEVVCVQHNDNPNQHIGWLLDRIYPGSKTIINWLESDRRTYHGEWVPCVLESWCALPDRHHGECES